MLEEISTDTYLFPFYISKDVRKSFPSIFSSQLGKRCKIVYHVTVEFRITMQFEANSRLSFNWRDKKEEVFCYVLGQILQRFLCRVDSYFALKKQCHPKHFNAEFLPLYICICSLHTFPKST